jgi:hypothetical protein
MAREVEVEIPVIVTVTIPDGYSLSSEDIAEIAYDTISQQCSICIEERDGQPVEWASCYSEVLTDETKVNGVYLTQTAGLE